MTFGRYRHRFGADLELDLLPVLGHDDALAGSNGPISSSMFRQMWVGNSGFVVVGTNFMDMMTRRSVKVELEDHVPDRGSLACSAARP
jgi:hypothetical protein